MPDLRGDVKAIFGKALDIESEDERSQYLDQACAGDEALRAEIDELLGAIERAGNFLGGLSVDGTANRPITEGPGTQIGPYKLLQQIGEGGMGVVYMAEQAEPVERHVALKIVKPGMDTRQVIARFESERQALAMMDHPNIAKVLEAGTTDSGRPYFVMELVKGVPVTRYCDEHQLSPRERLELFVPVCQAVQHAHQKGIIHRDIKPSNVIVAEYDDRPVPKIIDFGVAKAIEQRLTEKTAFTEFGQIVGTIEYMSPEQAKLNQLDIDTRSDIYSLGVLLYELLTGETPFDPERLRSAAFDELLRIIREEEPPKPSLRVSTSDALPSIAANRHIEPKKLSTLVRGELDWIVMKALEKDRARRYETANGFAADIQRFLSDEPVEACPPSAAYRIRKFTRRNRLWLATAGMMGLGVLVAVVALIVSNVRIQAEQEQTMAALRGESQANENLTTALARERQTLYFHRIALAQRELADNYVRPALALLDACPKSLRHWEWYHLSWLTDQSQRTLEGHTNRVSCVSVRPDGEEIAAGGWDGTVRVWKTKTGQPVYVLPARFAENGDVSIVRAIDYSPDGTQIVAATGPQVRIWDCETRKVKLEINAHQEPVNCVRYSADANLIVSGSDDGTVKVWSSEKGELEHTLSGHEDGVLCVAFSPDGAIIASGSEDKSIRLWDAATGELTKTIGGESGEERHGHRLGVTSIAFSTDGKQLASGSWDNTIKLWDFSSGKHRLTIRGHRHWIGSVEFDHTGSRIVSACGDNSCKVWDTVTGAELLNLRGHLAPVRAAEFTPDDRHIVSGGWDNQVKLWDAAAREEVPTIQAHADIITCIVFSPDGHRFASSGLDGAIKLWDSLIGREVRVLLKEGAPVHWLAFSPDGAILASAGQNGVIRLWEPESGAEIGSLADHAGPVLAVAISPDGHHLASGSGDKTLKIWDLRSGRPLRTLTGHSDGVYTLAYSPGGQRIVTGSLDKTCKVWDAETGKELLTFRGHSGPVGSVVYSPDGTKIASASPFSDRRQHGEVKLWDATDGTELSLGQAGNQTPRSSVAFSPDGRRLVASGNDRSLMLWDAETGEEALMLRGHRREVGRAVFSPDGRRIVSGCFDGTIKIWPTAWPK